MLKDTIKTIATSLIVLSMISVAYAWTEPTSNPPANNASAPINNSVTDQSKAGGLGIKGWLRGYTGALFTGTTSTNPVSDACPSGYYWVDENDNGTKNANECKIISLFAGSSGNVGIGTTAPTNNLTFGSSPSRITTDTTDGSDSKFLQLGGGGNIGADRGATIELQGNELASLEKGTLKLLAGNVPAGVIQFSTGGLLRMIVGNNGNVGIGTATDPTAKLEVAGQVKITGGSPGANKVLTSDATGLASWATPPGGGGVSKIIAGSSNITISPLTGTGDVTISVALPNCNASEYIRKKSDNSGWECVSGLWGPAGAMHYFLTAMSYDGNMGGLLGIDAKCNSDSNRLPSRQYKAVISGSWGVPNATYFGDYGTGVRFVDPHSQNSYASGPYNARIWQGSAADCSSWTQPTGLTATSLEGIIGEMPPFYPGTIGTISYDLSKGVNIPCGDALKILCVEVAK